MIQLHLLRTQGFELDVMIPLLVFDYDGTGTEAPLALLVQDIGFRTQTGGFAPMPPSNKIQSTCT